MKKLFGILLAICLIVSIVPVFASAAGGTAKVSVISDANGSMTTLELAEGGTTRYMITENGLAHEQTATASNYNIKFEWVTGGKPTLYLKGADLKAPDTKRAISVSGTAEEVVIYTESDSSMESNKSDIMMLTGCHLTFAGSGKLSLTVNGNGFAVNVWQQDVKDVGPKYDITFDDANIDLTMNLDEGAWGCGFGNHSRDITVSGGTMNISLTNSGVFYSNTPGQNSNLYIKNSANIKAEQAGGKTASFVRVENTIVIESGNVYIRHGGTSAFYAPNEFKIKGGTLDVVGGAFSYGVAPDFSEYEGDCTVIVCNSTDGKGAKPYNPENAAKEKGFVYFKITPGASYEVAVKNGTADKSVVSDGDTVTITARIAPEGKLFDKWEVNEGTITLADPTASTTTFVMPKENVKVTATYKDAETENNTGNDTNNNAGNDTNNNAGNDTNNNTGNDTNTNTGNDTNTNTGNDANTNNDNGKKKNNGILIVFIVMIVVLVLAIAAVVVFTVITLKRMKPAAAPAEEVAEEAAEEAAEEPAEEETEE